MHLYSSYSLLDAQLLQSVYHLKFGSLLWKDNYGRNKTPVTHFLLLK